MTAAILIAGIIAIVLIHNALKTGGSKTYAPTKNTPSYVSRPNRRPAPEMHGSAQTAANQSLELRRAVTLIKKDRPFRRDYKRLLKDDATADYLMDRFVAIPEIRDLMGDLPRPRVRVVGVHTVDGQRAAGSMKTYAKSGPVLTMARGEGPDTILHELAHYVVDSIGGGYMGHVEAWSATYNTFLQAAYPSKITERMAA